MAFATQAGVYLLNKESALVDFRFPATLVWWHLPARALGMYVGSHDQGFEWVRRNHRLSICVLAAVEFDLPPGGQQHAGSSCEQW
ncbi:hypothetical protein DC3_22640 [Deinococcus cellulosilyticus NBRC 106333 = KACC 11606]|uniref:Uncharacterized protein n=2 Tax=Deinococcus cellulosilyticus TaxID=401558 RepID=A0A511N1F4_DEIC1|nr:hypothetical protein DC3_22640 [Deinococcus cellulosilyticus NBRC 106333 = KACC 11606]